MLMTDALAIDTGDMGKLTFSGRVLQDQLVLGMILTPSANEEAHGVHTMLELQMVLLMVQQ